MVLPPACVRALGRVKFQVSQKFCFTVKGPKVIKQILQWFSK